MNCLFAIELDMINQVNEYTYPLRESETRQPCLVKLPQTNNV